MSVFSLHPTSVGAVRLLAGMAIFAFTAFIAVDPFMVEGSIEPLVKVRLVWILGAALLLWSTWTRLAHHGATAIGMAVCVWTLVHVYSKRLVAHVAGSRSEKREILCAPHLKNGR